MFEIFIFFSDAVPQTNEVHPNSNYFSNPSYHTLAQCTSPPHVNNLPYGKVSFPALKKEHNPLRGQNVFAMN